MTQGRARAYGFTVSDSCLTSKVKGLTDILFSFEDTDMGARHRARASSIHIIRVEEIAAAKCRRPNITQFHVSTCIILGNRCFYFCVPECFQGFVRFIQSVVWLWGFNLSFLKWLPESIVYFKALNSSFFTYPWPPARGYKFSRGLVG